jgi:hypothetical protein
VENQRRKRKGATTTAIERNSNSSDITSSSKVCRLMKMSGKSTDVRTPSKAPKSSYNIDSLHCSNTGEASRVTVMQSKQDTISKVHILLEKNLNEKAFVSI